MQKVEKQAARKLKNRCARRGKREGLPHVKKTETSDNVDNFVEKRVEKKGITVDEMWKTGENGDSQKKNRG